MSGLPTVKVEIESTTPGAWYDITAYVDLASGLSDEHGRRDEEDTIDAAYLRLRVDNTDARFTLGAPTYELRVDQRIRFTETVGGIPSIRHTGYVQDWPVDWLSPNGSYAKVQVVSTDRMARLARRNLPDDLYVGDISGPDLSVHYALTEPAGTATVGDTSGRARPPLAVVSSGAPIAFGVEDAPSTGTSVEITQMGPAPIGQQGQYLGLSTATQLVPPSSDFGFEILFKKTSGLDVYGGALFQLNFEGLATTQGPGTNKRAYLRAFWDNSTDTIFVGASGPNGSDPAPQKSGLTDGRWHHLAVYCIGGQLRVYFDGVRVGPTPAFLLGVGMNMLYVGGSGTDVAPVSVRVQHVAILTGGLDGAVDAATCDAVVAAHASAALDVTVDSSSARIARLADFARVPTAEREIETGSVTHVSAQSGGKVLDAMQQVAETEGGTVFVDADGILVFQGRQHRVRSATRPPVLSVTAGEIDPDDVVISADKQYLVNTATGSRPDGATQSAVDDASVAEFDEYPATLSLLSVTDAEVLDAVQWRVAAYSQPRPRCSQVTLDLLTLPTETVQAALALQIGDRIVISDLPPTAPRASLDLIVEGWTETLQVTGSGAEWSLTLSTAPAELFRAWVLGDSVYGRLGSTTRLYY